MKKIHILITLAVCTITCQATITDNPFGYYNVYSLNDIGSSSAQYRSDMQGTVGAGGNVYFREFSLAGQDSSNTYSLHTQGNASLWGAYNGNIDVGGNLTFSPSSLNGNAFVGGNVSNSEGGSISGNLTAAGSINLTPQFTVTGQQQAFSSVSQLVNYQAIADYFLNTSTNLAAHADNAAYTNNWGGITLNAASGENFITIDATELRDAWGFTINGAEDAIVYINVTGENVEFNSTNWTYQDGISASNVLVNFSEADTMHLTSNNAVNILAPNADTNFQYGVVTGSLIVGNLTGAGQVNLGTFEQTPLMTTFTIPEPATLFLLSMGTAFIIKTRKKLHTNSKAN